MMLKDAGLKRYSGPFDWIFSNLRMVCDCIDDDFATLLDPQYLEALPTSQRHSLDSSFADHRFYQRRYNINTIFNHYDPTTAEGYAYLERCVSRFRQALNSGRPHLLLAIATREQGGRYGFNRLCDILERHPSIDALVLIRPDMPAPPELELWDERGRHRLGYLHTPSDIAGVRFRADEDNAFLCETLRETIILND